MGQATFILSTGFVMMVGLYALNMTRADVEMGDTSTRYGDKRQARQIALSGVSIATNKLRDQPSWTTGYSDTLMGGVLNVTVDSTGLVSGQRRVRSSGRFFGETHEVTAIVQVPQSSSTFNMSLLNAQAAMEAQGRSFTIQSSQTPPWKFFINAFDTVGGITKHGIGASQALTAARVITALDTTARDSVVGLGSNPSVITLSSVVDRNIQRREIQRIASIVHRSGTLGRSRAWGTVILPEIVYVTRNLTVDYPLTGAGILCIKGNLTIRSTLNWSGYVIVDGNTVDVRNTGVVRIDGTVFYGKLNADLRFGSSGSMKIFYNSRILSDLNSRLFVVTLERSLLLKMFD